MSLELPFGIRPVVPLANIDERYGPYQSRDDALIGTQGTRVIGLTVGVIIEGSIIEYWFKSGISDEELIPKIQEQSVLPLQEYSHITLNNYSPAEDIQPEPDEIRLADTIWKTRNENWDDGGAGIFYANNDPLTESDFGLLYSREAMLRLLAANPGYRLPRYSDYLGLLQYSEVLINDSHNYTMVIDADRFLSTDQNLWESTVDWSGDTGLNIVAAGVIKLTDNSPFAFKTSVDMWYDRGELSNTRYTFLEAFRYRGEDRLQIFKDLVPVSEQYFLTQAMSVRLVKDI